MSRANQACTRTVPLCLCWGYGGSLFNKHDPYEKDDEEADQIYQVIRFSSIYDKHC